MADTFNNITETFILSEKRNERYLSLWEPGAGTQPLKRKGISAAGIGELVPPYDIQRKDSPFHVIIYTFSGSGRSAELKARPGKLFAVPAGHQHYWSKTEWEMIWFHISRGMFPGLDQLKEPTLLEFSNAALLRELMRGFCDEQALDKPLSRIMLGHYSELIAIQLQRNLVQATDPLEIYNTQKLDRIWELVEANLNYPWKSDELARHFGLSSVQFYRTVVKYEGVPPMTKVQGIRLRHAADLLTHTSMTLEAIAGEVGFQSPFSLSRAFKRRHGKSPREFRNAHCARRSL